MEKQSSLINRWDFKLLEPDYVKTPAGYQLAMYQAYFDYYDVFRDFFNFTITAQQAGKTAKYGDKHLELMDKYLKIRQTNQDLYFKSFDNGQKIIDWRKNFAQVPMPDCSIENIIIPQYYSPSPTPPASIEDIKSEIKT